ncbi:MAG: nitroreductase family deazaflavin-dependent oxidoreductase [Candidatus Promineifilaceae bacterium]|nr:nitroreductase family deazaflavin-dependent oxidoreductase [Anaerolineaceae bacterium]
MSSQNEWNQKIIEEFRANEGKVGGVFANTPLLLLHTTGAKSGQKRINPLAYLEDGARYVIVASKGGAPTHPDWYYNVMAHPEVEVEVGTKRFSAQAAAAEEPERSELYEKMVAKNPGFDEYRRKTSRTIPVIVLTLAA